MKRFIPALALAIIAMALTAACAAPGRSTIAGPTATPAATVAVAAMAQKITPAEAKKRLDGEPGIVLVDVRTESEYAEGHIKGSILLPLDQLPELAAKQLPDKGAVIFVYCRSGRRSATAASMLAGMGYTQVYDLGGIIDWPYEVVKG